MVARIGAIPIRDSFCIKLSLDINQVSPQLRDLYGLCQSNGRSSALGAARADPKRRLGREGAPLGQRGGAPLFVSLAGDEMALLIEMVVDLGMN